jgi:Anti-sigma-K factor rskA
VEASAAPAPVRLVTHSPPNGSSVAAGDAPPAEVVAESSHAFDPALELPKPHRVSGVTLAALAAVTGLAAIALGTWAFVSSVRDDGDIVEVVRTAPVYGAAQAISLLSKPSTQRIPLKGSEGAVTLAVAPRGRGLLVLDGLAIAPIGLNYQAWVVEPKRGKREQVSAGTFTGIETVVPLSARIPPGWFVGVTVERSGGADTPTGGFRFGAQR